MNRFAGIEVESKVGLVHDGMKRAAENLDFLPDLQLAGIGESIDALQRAPVDGEAESRRDFGERIAGADGVFLADRIALDDGWREHERFGDLSDRRAGAVPFGPGAGQIVEDLVEKRARLDEFFSRQRTFGGEERCALLTRGVTGCRCRWR
jgi:hypothetical protein